MKNPAWIGFPNRSIRRLKVKTFPRISAEREAKQIFTFVFSQLFFFLVRIPAWNICITQHLSWKGTRQVTKMLPIDVFYLPMTIKKNQKANNMQKLWNTRNDDSKQFQRGVKSIMYCPATLYCKKVNWISQPEVCSSSCVLSEHSNILTQLQLYLSIKY